MVLGVLPDAVEAMPADRFAELEAYMAGVRAGQRAKAKARR